MRSQDLHPYPPNQATDRSHTDPTAIVSDMTTELLPQDRGGAFLLELLYFAGWRLQVRNGETPTIRARRADVELEVSGSSLADAAGIVFARAMRSRKRKGKDAYGGRNRHP